MDYMLYEMYNLSSKQRKTIMTRGKNNKLIKTYNDFTYKPYFLMKDKFDNKFKKYLHRDFLVINENNIKEFTSFIKKHPIFFAKPLDGQCGKRIEKIEFNSIEKEIKVSWSLIEMMNRLMDMDSFVELASLVMDMDDVTCYMYI